MVWVKNGTSALWRGIPKSFDRLKWSQVQIFNFSSLSGWFSVSMDTYLQNSIPIVRAQLAKLWGTVCLKFFTKPLVDTVNRLPAPPPPPVPQISSPDAQFEPVGGASSLSTSASSNAKHFFIKAFEKTMKIRDTNFESSSGGSQMPKQV